MYCLGGILSYTWNYYRKDQLTMISNSISQDKSMFEATFPQLTGAAEAPVLETCNYGFQVRQPSSVSVSLITTRRLGWITELR